LIPHIRLPDLKTRLASPIRCCPNCDPASGALFLRQNRAEPRSGGAFEASFTAARLNRWRFAVQIGFSKNLIWTGVVRHQPGFYPEYSSRSRCSQGPTLSTENLKVYRCIICHCECKVRI
jgi:hypothetical protein